MMDDSTILDLYRSGDEQAIEETAQKYENYCYTIAHRILRNQMDAEECVNDTWFLAWNALAVQSPTYLSSYLGTITRNLALSKYRAEASAKRKKETLPLEFYQDILPGGPEVETALEYRELEKYLKDFLSSASPLEREIFVRKYYHLDTIKDISFRLGIPQGTVKSRLFRIRQRLRGYLIAHGY